MTVAPRFWFLVTCADYEPWIGDCLASIEEQDHAALGLLVSCDGSTDGTEEIVRDFAARSCTLRDIRIHTHERRAGKAQRVCELMREIESRPDDVVAFLDGDDRLMHPQAARRMEIEFERGAEIAWSNFRYRQPKASGLAGAVGISRAIEPSYDVYREPYATSHLFCFRAGDFFAIAPENFLDEDGAYLRRGCDQCFTLPLLDRARTRSFVPEFFVEYNNETPWQNKGDGAAAARGVALVRKRRLLRGSARDRAIRIARDVAYRLSTLQTESGGMPEPSFYATAHAAALWMHVDPDRYASEVSLAWGRVELDRAAARATRDAEHHWEFELLASTSVDLRNDPRNRNDNRRVLNWQLLLFLIELRLGKNPRDEILDRVLANVSEDGALPDFDRAIDASASYSDQYQAFCSYLLDEIKRARPTDARVVDLADRCGRYVVERARTGDVNRDGRGRRQIFGYAAAFRVLLLRGEEALAHEVLDRLEESRWQTGLFPLCLDDAERHFGPQKGWHGYNRYFDYLAFTGLLFAELGQ